MMKQCGAVLAALSLGACATSYSVTPVAGAAQNLTYDHGSPMVMSKKENGAVRVAPTSTAFEGG